jgi:hypothetical protein
VRNGSEIGRLKRDSHPQHYCVKPDFTSVRLDYDMRERCSVVLATLQGKTESLSRVLHSRIKSMDHPRHS